MNKELFRISVILLSGLLLFSPSGCSQPGHLRDGGPPIEPAEVTFDGSELVMTYHDSVIFSGHVGTSGEVFFNDLHQLEVNTFFYLHVLPPVGCFGKEVTEDAKRTVLELCKVNEDSLLMNIVIVLQKFPHLLQDLPHLCSGCAIGQTQRHLDTAFTHL